MLSRDQLDELVRRAGFDIWGVSPPAAADLDKRRHLNWLSRGYGAEMDYLARRPELRFDATSLLPGCKSVLVVGLGYFKQGNTSSTGTGKISRYAWGDDYHDVLAGKLRHLASEIAAVCPELASKVCVDTSPLAEKSFAVQAGLGWPGRNSLVLNPRIGSYFFIGLLLLELELDFDSPLQLDCGTCTACIQACPTDALLGPGILDARRCVSYLTTERKRAVEPGEALNGWLYGCDTCQEVCPVNADLPEAAERRFAPRPDTLALSAELALGMSEEQFAVSFEGTVFKRRRLERVQAQARNLLQAAGSSS